MLSLLLIFKVFPLPEIFLAFCFGFFSIVSIAVLSSDSELSHHDVGTSLIVGTS